MTYKHTKQTQERYAIKKSSKWKTAGSVLVASLIFGSSVVLNENKASADETNTESTLSTVTTGETTADLIEESVQTEDSSNSTETSTDTDTSTTTTTSDTASSATSTTSDTTDTSTSSETSNQSSTSSTSEASSSETAPYRPPLHHIRFR